jgi:hypothetical protein
LPTYAYTYLNPVTDAGGVVDAASEEIVRRKLDAQGFEVREIKLIASDRDLRDWYLAGKIGYRDAISHATFPQELKRLLADAGRKPPAL